MGEYAQSLRIHVSLAAVTWDVNLNHTIVKDIDMRWRQMNPLEQHLNEVVNPCWNYAGRIDTYDGHLQNAILGLVGETGETADIIKKMLYHTANKDAEYREKLKHELGDIAFYFAKVLELTGFTLEEVLQANKEKLESRHPELGKVAARFSDGYIK
jgi:NTP pyrophosphatase (non-canonical NTP hydrolase)